MPQFPTMSFQIAVQRGIKSNRLPELRRQTRYPEKPRELEFAEYYSRGKRSERKKLQRVFAEGSPQVFKSVNQKQNKINNKYQRGVKKKRKEKENR